MDYQEVSNNLRKPERTLVLKVKDGVTPKSDTGLLDKRMFQSKDNLIAYMEEDSNLWCLRYKAGILPEPLKQKFTSFSKLMAFAQYYFDRRGAEIVEVKD